MAQETVLIDEAKTNKPIQEIERILNEMNGIERVLIDTTDGEVKIEYDETIISRERIFISLQQHNLLIQ